MSIGAPRNKIYLKMDLAQIGKLKVNKWGRCIPHPCHKLNKSDFLILIGQKLYFLVSFNKDKKNFALCAITLNTRICINKGNLQVQVFAPLIALGVWEGSKASNILWSANWGPKKGQHQDLCALSHLEQHATPIDGVGVGIGREGEQETEMESREGCRSRVGRERRDG